MEISVELADDVVEMARREADRQNRSISDQIAHWIMLGSAIERSGAYDHKRVTQALEGRLDSIDLSEGEAAVWLEMFGEKMSSPSPAEKDVFEKRKKLCLGVGRDSEGRLVFARDGIQA